MTQEESQITLEMRKYKKHSPEWEELYAKWCDIQRSKNKHEPIADNNVRESKYANSSETYKIKAKYL